MTPVFTAEQSLSRSGQDCRNPELQPLGGKTLAEVAAMRGRSPEETAIDLVIEDDDRSSWPERDSFRRRLIMVARLARIGSAAPDLIAHAPDADIEGG